MNTPLHKNSIMECPRHGKRRPAFICQHLRKGVGLGFNQPEDSPDADWPYQNAWCDACEKKLQEEGEWNDRSEGCAQVLAICEGCFEESRARNHRRD